MNAYRVSWSKPSVELSGPSEYHDRIYPDLGTAQGMLMSLKASPDAYDIRFRVSTGWKDLEIDD